MKPYLKVTLAYLAFGATWILASDRLALAVSRTAGESEIYQTVKGLLFVSLSGGLIFFLTKSSFDRLAEKDAKRRSMVKKTVVKAHRILRNYLNQMQLVTLEAENSIDFDRSILQMAREISRQATEELDNLDGITGEGAAEGQAP